jgi:phage gp46-like protein
MTDLAVGFDGAVNELHFGLSVAAGDLSTTQGIETAVLYALFTDARIDVDELRDGETYRGGHWADQLLGESEGSKLWTLKREKQTQDTLNRAVAYAKEALQHLIDDGIATRIDVSASWPITGWLALSIVIWLGDDVVYEATIVR